MFKIITQYINSKTVKLSAITALLYCLLFNSALVLYKFDYYKINFGLASIELTKDFLFIYITNFIIFLGLAIYPVVFIIGTFTLFASGAIASYFVFSAKLLPNQAVIDSIFNTNISEVSELLNLGLITWLVVTLFISFYIVRYFSKADLESQPVSKTKIVTKLLSGICLLISINAVMVSPYRLIGQYFPLQYLHHTYMHFFQESYGTRLDISKEFKFIDNSDEDIVGVFVIGESARYDHFGVNGYERDTTPRLKELNNLYSFKAQSCATITNLSVPCMLSRHPRSDLQAPFKETSFLSIFTNLGFDTNIIANHSLNKFLRKFHHTTIYDDVKFAMTPSVSTLVNFNSIDGLMLPYIENMLKIPSPQKQFLVVHSYGSHWNYSMRYTAEFDHFTPTCDKNHTLLKTYPNSCELTKLINSYDNSILYTDFFLHSIISLLKDRNAFLIYSSDHGESLGEDNRFYHGSNNFAPEQRVVPLIVWFSDKFLAKHPDIAKALRSHKDEEGLSHDNIFHTFFDCLNIESEIIDKALSLCKIKKNNKAK